MIMFTRRSLKYPLRLPPPRLRSRSEILPITRVVLTYVFHRPSSCQREDRQQAIVGRTAKMSVFFDDDNPDPIAAAAYILKHRYLCRPLDQVGNGRLRIKTQKHAGLLSYTRAGMLGPTITYNGGEPGSFVRLGIPSVLPGLVDLSLLNCRHSIKECLQVLGGQSYLQSLVVDHIDDETAEKQKPGQPQRLKLGLKTLEATSSVPLYAFFSQLECPALKTFTLNIPPSLRQEASLHVLDHLCQSMKDSGVGQLTIQINCVDTLVVVVGEKACEEGLRATVKSY